MEVSPSSAVSSVPAQIFVSYARDDTPTVVPIVERLRAEGFSLWIDLEGIEGAAFWRKEIVDAIERSDVVLFFASRASCASENISKELALASEERKAILPVFVENAKLPSELRYQLAGLQRIAWHDGPDAAYRQTVAALGRLVARRPAPSVTERPTGGPSLRIPERREVLLAGTGGALALAAGFGAWQFAGRVPQSSINGDATPTTSSSTRTASPSPAQVGSSARLRAVVIGNQNYAVASRLMNPISDARAISQVLRKQGFVATEMFDLTSGDMRERLSAIYAEGASRTRGIVVRPSTPGPAVYFFFYSGHALTMDNQPCVVPVDVDMTNEASVRRYVVPFKDLLASNFGLAPRNQITLYSAAPGQVAFDGDASRNSPFTESFIRHLQNPALDVATMFSYVTREVRRKTDDRQTPWVEGSLDSPLFLGDLARTPLEGTTLVSVLDSCRDAPFSPARK